MDEVKYLGYTIGDRYEINLFLTGATAAGERAELCVDLKTGRSALAD
ncbi:hypothetical protein VC0101557_07690 [Vibrio cholerae VC0101557]|nr:hypothetical protein VC0101557_07690 [Vibrio cholerae VC0101557]